VATLRNTMRTTKNGREQDYRSKSMTEYTIKPTTSDEAVTAQVEVVQPIKADIVAQLERAAVDVQVATAHAYPRDRQKALQAIVNEALQDSESMIYTLRYVNHKTGEAQVVQGASVRLAEVVAQNWGNIRVWASVIEARPEYVRARGSAWDMQSNAWATEEVVVPTLDKKGQPYPERLRILQQQSAVSKAFRNVVLRVVPRSVVNAAINAIKRQQVVTPKAIASIRNWLKTIKVSEAAACRVIGAQSLDSITPEQLATIRGIYAAIRDGELTIEDAFGLDEAVANGAQQQQQTTINRPVQTEEPATVEQPGAKGPSPAVQQAPLQAAVPEAETREEKLERLFAAAEAAGIDRASVIEVGKMIGWGADPAQWRNDQLEPIVSNLDAAIAEMKSMLANMRKRKAAAGTTQQAQRKTAVAQQQPAAPQQPKQDEPQQGTLIDDLLV
jgi:hypothetical protein